ncbi:MAG: hypothetical protein AAFX54_07995 [Pseudomonadota bacterium]
MTRIDLPEGVPPDNEATRSFKGNGFQAPDMATPAFTRETPGLDHKAKRIVREEYEEIVEDDDDEDDERPRPRIESNSNTNLAIMIAVTALFVALGAIVVANNRGDAPLCSSQPAWNQYNCRAG